MPKIIEDKKSHSFGKRKERLSFIILPTPIMEKKLRAPIIKVTIGVIMGYHAWSDKYPTIKKS